MAGNIIPAIATTNAVIAGLIVMEALKVLAGDFKKCKQVWQALISCIDCICAYFIVCYVLTVLCVNSRVFVCDLCKGLPSKSTQSIQEAARHLFTGSTQSKVLCLLTQT